jgi:hypothetical protein
MLRKFAAPIFCLTALIFFPGIKSEDDPPAADIFLDGMGFMSLVPINEEFMPDPQGEMLIPVYSVFGQQGNRLSGSMVSVDANALFPEAPALPEIKLDADDFTAGIVKGKRFSMIALLDLGGQIMPLRMKGKMLSSGIIKVTSNIPSGKLKINMIPVNYDGTYISGLYVGAVGPAGASAPVLNNMLVGVIQGANSATFAVYYFDAEGLKGGVGEGVIDPDTGAYTAMMMSATGMFEMSGAVGDGAFTCSFQSPDGAMAGMANFFGIAKAKNPKAKRLVPASVKPKNEVLVRLKHKFCVPGTLVTIPNGTKGDVDVYIKQYSLAGKFFRLVLSIDQGFSGDVNFKLLNPNGRSVISKALRVK